MPTPHPSPNFFDKISEIIKEVLSEKTNEEKD